MGSFDITKLFGAGTGRSRGVTTYYGAPVSKTSAIAYKTSGYASIPHERSPKHVDSVPTKYADGTPFWADYVTPDFVVTA